MKKPFKYTRYVFTGPDGRQYRKRTTYAKGDIAMAQFIPDNKGGWAFIGMRSLVHYIAFDGEKDTKIICVEARRVEDE